MLAKGVSIASALLLCAAMPFYAGCACGKGVRTAKGCGDMQTTVSTRTTYDAEKPALRHTADLPPNAVPGECYAKVFVPPKFETLSERVCVREASERLEIIPAQYEWVEERVMVKDATTELIEEPAEFETQERLVEVERGHTSWELNTSDRCRTENGERVRDVFCLVNHPPVQKTVRTERLVKPARVTQVTTPAEYEMVRRQKLVCAATTKKIAIPAEYEEIQKTVQVAAGHMEWQRVICEASADAGTANAVKVALSQAGYDPGSLNGELDEPCMVALTQFQQQNALGIGHLSYETLAKLGVEPK
jgi:hypothetical protein